MDEGIRPENIDSVVVDTYEVGVLQCGFSKYPESGVEAKFSIPYTCGAAFVRGKVTMEEFTEEALQDPQIMRIAKSVTVRANELFSSRYPGRWGSRMTVTLKDGQKRVCQIDDMSGSVAAPLSPRQEMDKFMGMAKMALGEERAGQLCEDIRKIETLKRLPDLS